MIERLHGWFRRRLPVASIALQCAEQQTCISSSGCQCSAGVDRHLPSSWWSTCNSATPTRSTSSKPCNRALSLPEHSTRQALATRREALGENPNAFLLPARAGSLVDQAMERCWRWPAKRNHRTHPTLQPQRRGTGSDGSAQNNVIPDLLKRDPLRQEENARPGKALLRLTPDPRSV